MNDLEIIESPLAVINLFFYGLDSKGLAPHPGLKEPISTLEWLCEAEEGRQLLKLIRAALT